MVRTKSCSAWLRRADADTVAHRPAMTRIVIQWQDQFGRWQRFQEKHNQADASRTAQARARSTRISTSYSRSQLSTAARLVPLEGAMQEILFVVEEAEDGSFRASAAAAAIHTEAETLEELHREIRDAVLCHFDPGQAPPLIRLHHVKQELLAR